MKNLLPRLLLLLSLALAGVTQAGAWAYGTFQQGETDAFVNLPIQYTDPVLRLQDCPRGQVPGLSRSLDAWLWAGRIANIGVALFWGGYLVTLLRLRRILEALAGFLGVAAMEFVLLLGRPVVECQWIELPGSLVFLPPWRISFLGVGCMLLSLLTGLLAARSIRSISAHRPRNHPPGNGTGV